MGIGNIFPNGKSWGFYDAKKTVFIKISIRYGDMDSSVSRDHFQSMLEGIF